MGGHEQKQYHDLMDVTYTIPIGKGGRHFGFLYNYFIRHFGQKVSVLERERERKPCITSYQLGVF